MEKRLIDDLLALEGVICASLISPDGFAIESSGAKNDLSPMVNLFDLRPQNSMLTTVGENGTLIGIKLDSNHVIAVRCQVSCNLGLIRIELKKVAKSMYSIL